MDAFEEGTHAITYVKLSIGHERTVTAITRRSGNYEKNFDLPTAAK